MDEQFEKTENSMSIYYTVNKMLIALHMALLVFFVVMRVYVMVAFCAAGIVVYIFSYRLLDNQMNKHYYKITYYEIWICAAGSACIMGPEYGFHLALIAMLLQVALAVNTENSGNDTRFFKCSFTKKEGVFLVAATIIVYVMMKLGTYHDSFFGRHIILHNSVLQNVVFLANTTFIIIYIFYYLSSYAVYINKSEEFLRQKADYDELTGLYNRNRIRFILEHNYAAAKEGNNPFGVAIMDIDDFKKINDGYGHNAGDFVLKRFAGIVDGIVRKCEGQIVAGRWGGEEFLILYYGENKEDFYMLLEYIRMKIYEAQFLYDRNRLSVSVTIGMAAFAKDMSLDEIINNADMKLYEGKKSGKNKVM